MIDSVRLLRENAGPRLLQRGCVSYSFDNWFGTVQQRLFALWRFCTRIPRHIIHYPSILLRSVEKFVKTSLFFCIVWGYLQSFGGKPWCEVFASSVMENVDAKQGVDCRGGEPNLQHAHAARLRKNRHAMKIFTFDAKLRPSPDKNGSSWRFYFSFFLYREGESSLTPRLGPRGKWPMRRVDIRHNNVHHTRFIRNLRVK